MLMPRPTGPSDSSGDEDIENFCTYFIFGFKGVVSGIFCIFGITGNVISFVVFHRVRRRNVVITLLMRILAISDTVHLLLFFINIVWIEWFMVVGKDDHMWNVRRYMDYWLFPFYSMSLTVSTWSMVSLAGHRYIAVAHPLLADRIGKVEVVKVQFMVIIVIAVCIDITRFFESELITEIGANNESYVFYTYTDLYHNDTYQLLYKTIFVMTLKLLLPIVLTLTFVIGLAHAVLKTRQRISAIAANKISVGGPSISSKGPNGAYTTKRIRVYNDGLTISFILIALFTLICLSPGIAYCIYRLFLSEFMLPCPNAYGILIEVADTLLILNSATNFYIYYPTLETFRRDVRRLLSLKRRQLKTTPPFNVNELQRNGHVAGGI